MDIEKYLLKIVDIIEGLIQAIRKVQKKYGTRDH